MSLYNMLFGNHPAATVILATVGLKPEDTGRFRDCWVEKDSRGAYRIAVYTRNGGGNRDCWHEDDPKYGNPTCKHHEVVEDAHEYAFMPKEEWPDGKAPGSIYCSRDGVYGCEYRTGKMVPTTYYHCDAPDSEECSCPGCIITYRAHRWPGYICDRDDEFDNTYATIYLTLPEEYRAELEAIAENQPVNQSKRWTALIESLKGADHA